MLTISPPLRVARTFLRLKALASASPPSASYITFQNRNHGGGSLPSPPTTFHSSYADEAPLGAELPRCIQIQVVAQVPFAVPVFRID